MGSCGKFCVTCKRVDGQKEERSVIAEDRLGLERTAQMPKLFTNVRNALIPCLFMLATLLPNIQGGIVGIPTNGLVGQWLFEGNANDSSGNGYNGTVYGASLTTDRFGSLNSAYFFDGTGNTYIDIGNLPAFNFGFGDFTLSAWVFTQADGRYLISKYTAPSPGFDPDPLNPRTRGYGLSTEAPGAYAFLSEAPAVLGPPNLNDGRWHFIAATYSRSSYLGVHVDGALVATGNIAAASILDQNNSESLLFGKLSSGSFYGPQAFYGSIDDIRIYNRALSAEEVATLYSFTPTVPEPSTYMWGLLVVCIAALHCSLKRRKI